MNKTTLLKGLLLFAALSLIFPAPQAAFGADWTFMVYLDADNDLEDMGIADFQEMATAGSNSSVNIVVIMDRCPSYADSYGNWTGTRRGRIELNDEPYSSWGEDIGEQNMGDDETLSDFLIWSAQNYPADHYALVLWNHGAGWRDASGRILPPTKAICYDDTDGDNLSVKEVATALQRAQATTGKLDLISFDACLMSMVEVAYELRNYADVMTASEDLEPGQGWPYDAILPALLASPSQSAGTLATTVVNEYMTYYRRVFGDAYPSQVYMQTAIDLSQMDSLTSHIAALASTLSNSWQDQATCQAAAAAVMTSINAAVIHEDHCTNSSGSHGLAVYFPQDSSSYTTDYTSSIITFSSAGGWQSFLLNYFSEMQNTWVAQARASTQEYDTPEHVDLYDFCSKLGGTAVDTTDPTTDSDGDGYPDVSDGCPNDPDKIAPGSCGCGVFELDVDGDGVAECFADDENDDDDQVLPSDPGQPTDATGAGCGSGAGIPLMMAMLTLGLIRRRMY